MFLNQKGQQVSYTPANCADPLVREVKDVDNHRCHKMFKIGTRATFKGSQKKGWMHISAVK